MLQKVDWQKNSAASSPKPNYIILSQVCAELSLNDICTCHSLSSLVLGCSFEKNKTKKLRHACSSENH